MKIRRYYRQTLVLAAVLKLPGMDDIPCEIRNFCQAGLLLKLTGANADTDGIKQRSDAEIVFKSPRTERTFQLGGKLSHVSPHGIGFVFDYAPPFQVLLALQEKALAILPLEDRQLTAEQLDIHTHCVQALENALYPLLETLPWQIQTVLTEETGAVASDPLTLQRLAETAPPSEQQVRPIVESFYEQALEQAKSFIVPDLGLQPETGAVYSESLPQRLAFEDWINLVNKVIVLEVRYEGILKILESRFSLLAQRDLVNQDNPFGPNVLCHCFHYALQGLELNNHQRNAIYELFTRQLDERLERLYGDLRVLSKGLVPEEGAPSFVIAAATAGSADASGQAKPHAHAAKPEPRYKATAPPPHEAPKSKDNPFLPPADAPPAAAANSGAEPPSQARAAAPTHAGAAKVERPAPPDAFTAFVLLTRYTEAQAGRHLTVPDGDFNRAAVIAALQKLRPADNKAPHYFPAPVLQARLHQILAEAGEEQALVHVEVRENLQIIGLLLEAMMADIVILPCITTYIKKLQIPLFIASFSDPGLMYGRTHPAREILNQLDHLTQAANAKGEIDNAQLLQSLDKLFDRIANEVGNNPGVFAQVLKPLEKLTIPLVKAHATRLERVVEACEGGQRLEHARQLAEREIDARIGGKTIPSLILALLDAGWRQLLVLTSLRLGGSDDDWHQQLAVIDALMNCLTKPDQASPAKILDLKKQIQERLSGIGAEPTEISRILEKIDRCLPTNGWAMPSAVTYVDVPPADSARTPKETALRTRLSGFRVGDWLRFTLAQGAWVPLRLTWIGQEPARYVFANRKGVKSLDLNATRFAQFLDEKRASRIESLDNLSLVERSAKSLLSSLRDRLR